MARLELIKPKFDPKDRKHRRFCLRYPVQIRLQSGGSVYELQTITENISVGGLLLRATAPIPHEAPLNFVLTLHGGRIVRPIQLTGQGHVVRVQMEESGPDFLLAVQCNQPLSELEDYPQVS